LRSDDESLISFEVALIAFFTFFRRFLISRCESSIRKVSYERNSREVKERSRKLTLRVRETSPFHVSFGNEFDTLPIILWTIFESIERNDSTSRRIRVKDVHDSINRLPSDWNLCFELRIWCRPDEVV